MQYGKSQEAIDRLTAEQRRVTQEAGTERPFTGEYNLIAVVSCPVSNPMP
jgi:peptide-methionine (R)-S-oxide reductase